MAGLWDRVRGVSFDSWLFAGMMLFVTGAVGAGLYVSYTALRYVAETIGGMPPNVSVAFPLTIDAAVAAGLLGEWWLAGRRKRERLAFGYMLGFGLVFAGLTVGGNALHGALALSVQRPIELHVGGQLVPLPWWIPIAVSAVPGLAIAGAGLALSLVVAAWRRGRATGGALLSADAEALRQQLAEATKAAAANEAGLVAARAAREQAEQMLAESVAELRRQLADAEGAVEAARADATTARSARERGEALLASKTEAVALLERDLAEARVDTETSRAARERAEKLLASRSKAGAVGRRRGARQPAQNGARVLAQKAAHERNSEMSADGVRGPLPAIVANNGTDTADRAREQATIVPAVTAAEVSVAPTPDPSQLAVSPVGGAHEHAREQDGQPSADEVQELVPASVAGGASPVVADVNEDARERQPEVPVDMSTDGPEPPPDDRPRGGQRRPRNAARERAGGSARSRTRRVSGDEVRRNVLDAREQLLASVGEATDVALAELMAARGHRISASRVRGYLAEANQRGELGPVFPARRPRVLTGQAAVPAAAVKEA